MVLIQEAAALLYLGSTSQTCRGDGWAVRLLFMDHHPSPISYMPRKPRSLKNSNYLTALCLSISDRLPFSFYHLTNGILSFRVCFRCSKEKDFITAAIRFLHKREQTNITFTVIMLTECVSHTFKATEEERREREKQRVKGRSESNPTISPRVARFQLTTGWFISLQRVIAVFNHFLSLHVFFHSISSSHSYHLTPSSCCLARLPISARRCLGFITALMEPLSHAASSIKTLPVY